LDRFLVDGFVPVSELPSAKGDRWQLNPNTGALVARRSGKTVNIGDRFLVRIAQIDLARRQMSLAVVEQLAARSQQGQAGLPSPEATQKKSSKSRKKSGAQKRKQSKGAASAHEQTQKLKQQQKQDSKHEGPPSKRGKKSAKKSTKKGQSKGGKKSGKKKSGDTGNP
jgi:hypothetical protein